MFANKTPTEHGEYYLFMAKTSNICHYLVQKHDQKTVCKFLQRPLSLSWFCVLWRTMANTYTIILPCLVPNNWPNFVSEHLMFLPMFCHQTFVNACSAWNHNISFNHTWKLCGLRSCEQVVFVQKNILFNNWAWAVIMDPNNSFSAPSRYLLNYTSYQSHSNMVLSPFQSPNSGKGQFKTTENL